MISTLIVGWVLQQSIFAPEAPPPVPAYVPRAVYAGLFVNSGLVTPQLRLEWEINLAKARHDTLIAIISAGGGYGFGTNTLPFFYEHTVMAGVGYRAAYEGGFTWGFHATTGPVFYGAHVNGAPSENMIDGFVEGRAQAGFKVGAVAFGFSLGYASLYNDPRPFNIAGHFVGGPTFGFFVDWRG